MGDFNNYVGLLKSQYPPPLPPTRKIELIRTEVNNACSCRNSIGKLTCGRCKAIKYCGQQCQREGAMEGRSEGKEGFTMEGRSEGEIMEERNKGAMGRNGWKDHKNICNLIKKRTEETKASIEKVSKEFGGTRILLESPLASKEEYIQSRMQLIEAYVVCGEEALSCTAFRLAAENMLDVLCLSYSQPEDLDSYVRYNYCCGWMVAAGMDQQALNFLCYFRHRLMSPHSLPYLDMSREEDIEGVSYLKLFKDQKNYLDWAAVHMWYHDYMLIALIKYKRLQSLIVQKSEECEMEETIILRMNQLDGQIKRILSDVHACKPLIIPGLIDWNSIPAKISLNDKDMAALSGDELHALKIYGFAWSMSPAYIKVLKYFLRTGQVMPTFKIQEDTMDKNLKFFPGTGLLRTSLDTDPTRSCEDFGAGVVPGQFDDSVAIPNEDDPDVKQSKKKVEGCSPGVGLLQAALDVYPTRSCDRPDVLDVEGLVPLNLEFVKENIGIEAEKEKGNLVPEIVKETTQEVSALKMYSKICWFCSKEGVKLFKCGCRKARYCTKECQEEDWEEHGGYCIKKQAQRKGKERGEGDI